MALAIVQIPDTPMRLLKPKEAAIYCRFNNVKMFETACPIKSLDMGSGLRVYDIQDLDKWIDNMKDKDSSFTNDDVIAKLEAAE